jgi:hypothetical protein
MFPSFSIVATVGCIIAIITPSPVIAGGDFFCVSYPTVGECENQEFDKCLLTLNDGNSLNISAGDFVGLEDCGTCGDVFGDLNTDTCVEGPCDGLLCIDNVRYSFALNDSMRCDKDNVLQEDCSDCDTACLDMCDRNTVIISTIPQCIYDMTEIGELDTETGLCGGDVPQLLCDDTNITCVVFQFAKVNAEDILPDFDLDQSVRIFDSPFEYWAMNKATAMTTSFQSFDDMRVYSTTFCADIEPLYGSTNVTFSSESSSTINDGAASSLNGFLFF